MKNMNKNEEISLAIGKIVNSYGNEALQSTDSKNIKGLLMDLIPRYKNERALLLLAISCGVGTELYTKRTGGSNISDNTKRYCRKLLMEAYVSENAADMVINWIINSFDVKESLPKIERTKEILPGEQDFEICDLSSKRQNNDYRDSYQKLTNSQNDMQDSGLVIRNIARRFLSRSSQEACKKNVVDYNVNIEYNAEGNMVLKGDFTCDSIIFDENVEIIGARSFFNAVNLKNVTFTNGITKIGKEAFANCTALTRIVLLRNLRDMEEGIFKGCYSLENVKLPVSMDKIPASTFKKCLNLLDVNIPRKLTEIGDEAFRECESLRELIIPDTLVYIGDRAFMGCKELREITLGKGIKKIGRDAFVGCANDFCINIIDNMYVIKYCILQHIKYKRI